MHHFNYRPICRALIRELADLVMKGQSVALFAPRFGGKRYVMDRVMGEVESAGHSPIVRLRLLGERPLVTEQGLADQLRNALINSGIDATDPATDPFNIIEAYAKRTGKRVILSAANVDAIAHGLTRHLLQHFRKLVETRSLAVVLTGESDFHELVHGSNSEFTCSENYFLQGYTEEEFGELLDQYARTLSMPLSERRKILRLLWERTGGSSYLLRPMIVEVVERKVREGQVISAEPLTAKDFDWLPRAKAVPGNYWTQLCRHATRMIAWAPDCWDSLERLLNGDLVAVESDLPTPLEWFGVAVRREDHLYFASGMMENYARLHYDPLRFGDLYVRIGRWAEAFDRYSRLSIENKRRPLSAEDRTDTERILSAFGMALFSEAAKGEDEVKKLFVQGCQHLLGFGEVTFWRREDEWGLQPLSQTVSPLPQELRTNIARMLSDPATDGLYTVPPPWNEYAVAAALQSSDPNYSSAVIVSDLEHRVAITRERRRLLESLLQQFIKAHSHAVIVAKKERRLEIRNEQVKLINSVFRAMGSQVLDVDGVLKRSADGLQSLGRYHRVLFCLVDPKRERIRGVLDSAADRSAVNVAERTDYALSDIEADIQPWVIHTKQPFVTADAEKEKLTNKLVVRVAGMKAMAIVPILNYVGDAIGTIHIERDDYLKPSDEEVEDLMDFGRLLATAIEKAERVNRLQQTLDKIPEPIAIVNALGEFGYANKAAIAKLKDSSEGQGQSDDGLRLSEIRPEIRLAVEQALAGQRVFQHIGDDNNSIGVSSDRVTNWRGETVGAMLYIQERTDFDRAFQAFLIIASRRDTAGAMDAMLEVAKLLRYPQARLFVLEKVSGDLVGKHCYGMADRELAAAFDRGEIRLTRNQPDSQSSWLSIDRKEPFVFCYDPAGSDGERRRTAQGLEYVIVNPPAYPNPFKKKPGALWVDVPLLTEDRVFGKVTLPCDEYLRPERFELLKVFSSIETGLLDGFILREREQYEHDLAVLASAAEKVMADVAHNIATRFGSFPLFLKLYRLYEKQLPELKKLNEDFAHALDHAQTIVKRAKERFSPIVKLKRSRIELLDFLERVCQSTLPRNAWTATSAIGRVEMEMDAHLLEAAMLEMIENSRATHEDPDLLKIEIRIQCGGGAAADEVQIVYRNNGPKIPEETRHRIFEDFFSHRPGSERGSSGLGMGFIKRVIEAHGGRIEVGSPERGAEFIITLPRKVTNDHVEDTENINVSLSYR